jgi:hypothetical protein
MVSKTVLSLDAVSRFIAGTRTAPRADTTSHFTVPLFAELQTP